MSKVSRYYCNNNFPMKSSNRVHDSNNIELIFNVEVIIKLCFVSVCYYMQNYQVETEYATRHNETILLYHYQ